MFNKKFNINSSADSVRTAVNYGSIFPLRIEFKFSSDVLPNLGVFLPVQNFFTGNSYFSSNLNQKTLDN